MRLASRTFVRLSRLEPQTATAGIESDSLHSRNKPAGGVEVFQNPSCRDSCEQAPASQSSRQSREELETRHLVAPRSLQRTPEQCLCLGPGLVTGHNSPEFAAWCLHNLLTLTREGQCFLGIWHESRSVQEARLALSISPLVFLGTSGRTSPGPELFAVLWTWRWQQTRTVVVEVTLSQGPCQPEARRWKKLG